MNEQNGIKFLLKEITDVFFVFILLANSIASPAHIISIHGKKVFGKTCKRSNDFLFRNKRFHNGARKTKRK